MPKFEIVIDSNLNWGKEELDRVGLWLFKQKQKLIKVPLFTAINTVFRAKFDVKKVSADKIIFSEIADLDICEKDKKELEGFMFSTDGEFFQSEAYKNIKADRMIQSKLKNLKNKAKRGLGNIPKKILGGSVLAFLSGFGINVSWKLYKDVDK